MLVGFVWRDIELFSIMQGIGHYVKLLMSLYNMSMPHYTLGTIPDDITYTDILTASIQGVT